MPIRILTTFFAAMLFLVTLYADDVNADPPERLNTIISELIQILEGKDIERVFEGHMQGGKGSFVETEKVTAYWDKMGPDLLEALKTIDSGNLDPKIKDLGAYTAAAYQLPDPGEGLEVVIFIHSFRSNGDQRWRLHSFRYPLKCISGSKEP